MDKTQERIDAVRLLVFGVLQEGRPAIEKRLDYAVTEGFIVGWRILDDDIESWEQIRIMLPEEFSNATFKMNFKT